MPPMDSGSDFPQAKALTPHEERGRDPPARQANNEGSRIRRSECERISHWYFQIEEEVFLCIPLKAEEPTSLQEPVDSPNHKTGCYEE